MSYNPRSKSLAPHPETNDLERNMRRTLGVGTSSAGHRRRFAKDGEIPAIVLRGRSDDSRAAVEAAVQSEREARSHVERNLTAAQATIRNLQTQLAHMEMSLAELRQLVDRASGERQSLELALAAEGSARQDAEARLEREIGRRQTLERRVRNFTKPVVPSARLAGERPPRAKVAPQQTEQQPVDWWSKHEKK